MLTLSQHHAVPAVQAFFAISQFAEALRVPAIPVLIENRGSNFLKSSFNLSSSIRAINFERE
jgi:hypothetical protein